MISLDTIKNYNQVSGKKILAYFKDDKISVVNVMGNGQSIYHALEEDNSKVIGLNKSECSNIVIKFQDGVVRNISFIKKPDSKFIPPHEIEESDKKLKGFNWRIEEKPKEEEVVYLREKKPAYRIQIPYSYEYMEKKSNVKTQPSDNQYFLFN